MIKKIIVIENREHLDKVIKEHIQAFGNEVDLNHLDVSHVLDMSQLFYKSGFNGDISGWDVSNVLDMRHMFAHAKFNQNLTLWTPISLENSLTIFSAAKIKPYWAACETNQELVQKITEYHDNLNLKNKLEDELIINPLTKKMKL
jgi:hypothetical protein